MRKVYYIACLLLCIISCKKPYIPPVVASGNSYLVVEGTINSGVDTTVIKLSKTINLSTKTVTNPVTNALVTIESDQNAVYPLTETTGGKYVMAGANIAAPTKYRLRIKTTENKEYLSDFVQVVNAPAIDTVNYSIQGNGVVLNVSTHDPNNSTRYYKWDYSETWIFHSNYQSSYVAAGDTIVNRPLNAYIYQCWASDSSSTILLGSSAKLSQDVIVNAPIALVPNGSEKFTSKYSILVRQYSLTKDAYNFWQNLKKNTEQLGSIFDAQPSEISGNIHNLTNAAEPVIGYISAGSVSHKRIFITVQQLPAWPVDKAYPDCKLDTFLYKFYSGNNPTPINQVKEFLTTYSSLNTPFFIPVGAIQPPMQKILGYTASYPECVDCTLRGTNKQPAFWK